MNEHRCNNCGGVGYTAATQPEDLGELSCPYCGAFPPRYLTYAALKIAGTMAMLHPSSPGTGGTVSPLAPGAPDEEMP